MVALVVGEDVAVAHHEEVLARTFGDDAVFIHQQSFVEAATHRVLHREHRVQILAAGLGRRRHGERTELLPARDRYLDSLLQSVSAEVCTPRPRKNRDIHRAIARVNAEAAAAVERNRTKIAVVEAVGLDQFQRAFRQVFLRVRDREPIHVGRLEHALQVRIEAEYRWAVHRVVAADAFEHAGAVVQSVGRHVDRGVRPRNDLAILPDELALRKERHPGSPVLTAPRGLKPARRLLPVRFTLCPQASAQIRPMPATRRRHHRLFLLRRSLNVLHFHRIQERHHVAQAFANGLNEVLALLLALGDEVVTSGLVLLDPLGGELAAANIVEDLPSSPASFRR